MTSSEFLGALEQQLYVLTPDERESALSYYREYLEEAGTDVRAAIEALGSPQSVAERIIREIGESRVASTAKSATDYQYTADPMPEMTAPQQKSGIEGGRLALTIIVIILTFPIWITVFSVWFSLVVALVAVIASLAFAAIAAPIQGIGELFGSMIGEGLWDIGSGFFSAGLVLLLWKPFWLGIKYSAIGLGRACKSIINGLMGKER